MARCSICKKLAHRSLTETVVNSVRRHNAREHPGVIKLLYTVESVKFTIDADRAAEYKS